ncbi:MAG TPA: hypothetical protein VI279_12010 [Rhodocyclaceae bacterium]
MFISIPAIDTAVEQHIAAGQYNEALANIVVGVHNHYLLPEVDHRFLYYPIFDRHIQRLADILLAQAPAPAAAQPGDSTLIVTTLMSQVGGHSRVIEDVMAEVAAPVLVLTDLFWFYRKDPDQLNWLFDAHPDTPVIVLPQRSIWDKCRALHALTLRLQPRNILYFHNHQDPIPFVGTIGHPGSRKTLVHHCDHNPSLGNTLAAVDHADLTEEMAGPCARHLGKQVQVLPLSMPDGGRKAFAPCQGNDFSVVTSGTEAKFTRSGEMALQNVVATTLGCVGGRFYHIGPLAEDWAAEIKAHLARQQIDPARFVPLGPVESLWQTLLGLDAQLYIGSAPVGGGRASIEAQGCGYPVVYFIKDPGAVLALYSLYASKELGWSNLAELQAALQDVGPRLPRLSDEARALYDRHFSRECFRRGLQAIT